jgi:hypothetical protein
MQCLLPYPGMETYGFPAGCPAGESILPVQVGESISPLPGY